MSYLKYRARERSMRSHTCPPKRSFELEDNRLSKSMRKLLEQYGIVLFGYEIGVEFSWVN